MLFLFSLSLFTRCVYTAASLYVKFNLIAIIIIIIKYYLLTLKNYEWRLISYGHTKLAPRVRSAQTGALSKAKDHSTNRP